MTLRNPGPGFGPPPPDPAETSNVAGTPNVGDVPTWTGANGPAGHAAWSAGGGGGGGLVVVRVPLAHNTPGLVLTPGVPIYTPAAGDTLIDTVGWMSVTTVWNGTTPTLNFGVAGSLTDYTAAVGVTTRIGSLDTPIGAHAAEPSSFAIPQEPLIFLDATPLVVMVDDGSGGDPGSTTGAGELVLLVLPASA